MGYPLRHLFNGRDIGICRYVVVYERRDILVNGRDCADVEILFKNFENVGGEEGRECGAGVDVLYAEAQQSQEHDDGLLLVPRNVVDDGQVVYAVETKCVFQRQRYHHK